MQDREGAIVTTVGLSYLLLGKDGDDEDLDNDEKGLRQTIILIKITPRLACDTRLKLTIIQVNIYIYEYINIYLISRFIYR